MANTIFPRSPYQSPSSCFFYFYFRQEGKASLTVFPSGRFLPLRGKEKKKESRSNSLRTSRPKGKLVRKALHARTGGDAKSRSYQVGSYGRCQQVPEPLSPPISSPPRQAAPSSNKPLVIRRGRGEGKVRELFNASYQSNLYDKDVSTCYHLLHWRVTKDTGL